MLARAQARRGGALAGCSLQYTPYGGQDVDSLCRGRQADSGIRPAVSLSRRHHDDRRDVRASTSSFGALFGAGDEVIVLTPAWHDYPLYLRNLRFRSASCRLRADKHLDLDAIASAIGPRTRGLLFSQPCCPTGVALFARTKSRSCRELLASAERRFEASIYLVSDEVHRHMIWSGRPFYSPLRSYPRSLSIYSFGKALALQGQRIGYVAVSPRMPENDAVREHDRALRATDGIRQLPPA